MTTITAIELSPTEAAARVHQDLSCAAERLQTGDLGPALDAYSCALGLALQLGPALTEKVLFATLDAACELACSLDTEGLSALGPALVDLVTQVRDAGVLPSNAVMDAWASVATDVGALIGQVGLALAIRRDHRRGMMDNARLRAALLDDATGGLFNLTNWMDQIDPNP
jgi:hypothetical protein